jgi:sigma-B regulation protein RsbU (phosphoserine phosphatase)
MSPILNDMLKEQLVARRRQLDRAAASGLEHPDVRRLIREVDAALVRLDDGSYGLCEVCHQTIEPERLLSDPLARFCLDHLSDPQRRALETDLGLAAKIQRGLLPEPHLHHRGWEAAYHYEPASIVSGDYCDLVPAANGDLYFVLGDVTGKGVAASMLMAHLQAMFRSLIPTGLALPELVGEASRLFCQSTLPTHYATLACGRATAAGELEICNAGHLPPLLISPRGVAEIAATGLPLGAFCDEKFAASRARLEPGQAILLFTDGLTEARNSAGAMYGSDRLRDLALARLGAAPPDLVSSCLEDLRAFRGGLPAGDDLTILAIRRDPLAAAMSH